MLIMAKRVLAFLQARMGSTRLPGKVLLKIRGRSILERAVRRLQAAAALDEVVILTTTLVEDDAIVKEARNLGVRVYRGAAHDVLKRFQDAALEFAPVIVVRATADNPLIDIGSTDRIVRAVRSTGLDYCMELDLPIGAATEAITAAALERVECEGRAPRHREHVTIYVKENPDRFRVAFLDPPDHLRRPELRITVDTPQDFLFVERLIEQIPEGSSPIPLGEYLKLAGTKPEARSLKQE
jgi:spore coat polysaccharide biosynthesis protein SpsF